MNQLIVSIENHSQKNLYHEKVFTSMCEKIAGAAGLLNSLELKNHEALNRIYNHTKDLTALTQIEGFTFTELEHGFELKWNDLSIVEILSREATCQNKQNKFKLN
jgi:hypothetical protein